MKEKVASFLVPLYQVPASLRIAVTHPYLLLESCVVSGKVDSGHYLSQYPSSEHAARREDYYARLTQVRRVAQKRDSFGCAAGPAAPGP